MIRNFLKQFNQYFLLISQYFQDKNSDLIAFRVGIYDPVKNAVSEGQQHFQQHHQRKPNPQYKSAPQQGLAKTKDFYKTVKEDWKK